MHTRHALAICLLLGTAPAQAAPPDVLESPNREMTMTDWGVYDGIDLGINPARDTVAGTMTNSRIHGLLEQTDRICASDGTRFGIRYRLHGDPNQLPWVLNIQTDHPFLQSPTGRSGSQGTYKRLMRHGTQSYSGWSFAEPYEMVPGDWTFTIIQNDEVMLRKTFHIVFDCGAPTS